MNEAFEKFVNSYSEIWDYYEKNYKIVLKK